MAKKRLSPERAFYELVAVFVVIVVVGGASVFFRMTWDELKALGTFIAVAMAVAGILGWVFEPAFKAPAPEPKKKPRGVSMDDCAYWSPESGWHFDEARYNSCRSREDAGEYFER